MTAEETASRNRGGWRRSLAQAMSTARQRRFAWIPVLVVDAGFVAWGAAGAASPDHLLGPGGKPILTAGYEGYTSGSWSSLSATAPRTARYVEVLFRLYGVFNVAFGLTAGAIAATAFRRGDRWAWWATLVGNTLALASAMTYDRTAKAIGPFELSEYVGLAAILCACALTAPLPEAAAQGRRAG